MKITLLSAAVTSAVLMLSQAVQADEVKGGARADFNADELIVPCVAIEGYSEAADGTYFDLIFARRGKSFNYELKFGEPEDAAVCAELANYALFIDDDADDEEGEPEDDFFASCEVTHVAGEQTEASIKVKAKELEAGDYYVVVSSGEGEGLNELSTAPMTVEDELEVEFSSDGEGDEAIEASFIVDAEVTAELFDAGDVLVVSETVSCVVEQEDEEEEEEGDPA